MSCYYVGLDVHECRRHPASKLLSKVPTLGPVRVAQLISAVVTPHRFRGKRQFWSYCGLAVVTKSSGDHQLIGEQVRRKKRVPETRGLTRSHNRTLKYVFKSAALTASRCEPFKTWYSELLVLGAAPGAGARNDGAQDRGDYFSRVEGG